MPIDLSTAYQPGKTIDITGGSPKGHGTANSTSVIAGLLVIASRATYGNGVDVMGDAAGYAGTSGVDTLAMSVEVPAIHPESTVPFDITTAFAAGDHLTVIQHVVGNTYWLPASSITATAEETKLVPAGSGLVKAQSSHSGTLTYVHMWMCEKSVSSASWVRGRYMGIMPGYP